MTQPLKLMCSLAHPDDESLGTGGTLAKYAAEGIETYLVMATRGERGWQDDPKDYPGPEALGKIRQVELLAAASVLGLREVDFLDYLDGDLDQADPQQAIAKIAAHLRRVRPQVVITFGPDGGYGHPDHIAISQFTAAAIVSAADPNYHHVDGSKPHRVSKLYYMVLNNEDAAAYIAAFGDIAFPVDGVARHAVTWPDWEITTEIDTATYQRTIWQAALCHQTQLPTYRALETLPDELHANLWRCQRYYRVFSTVNGGRKIERDLFEGLR